MYHGVKRQAPGASMWDAEIRYNGRVLFIGSFPSPDAAARAYDSKGPPARMCDGGGALLPRHSTTNPPIQLSNCLATAQ